MKKKIQNKSSKNLTKSLRDPRSDQELTSLKHLGSQQTAFPLTYNPDLLEAFDNKNPLNDAWTTFVCTEFTSLCPKTGQPDFARIYINYIAGKLMVESKSLKLYLGSFRNHGDFHEDCIQKICNELSHLLSPKYLEVIGEFTPRGGMTIYPFASTSQKSSQYQKIREYRMMNYAPGKYSIDLSRIY